MRRFLAAFLALAFFLSPAIAGSLLPNGQQQFSDANGKPYAGGKVYFYIPSTTTAKDTWQDSGLSILNTNPVTLDAAGRATIYGSGTYRQILKDSLGNTIWDKLTADTTASGGTIWAGTSGGTGNAQTVTASGFSSTTGQTIAFIAGATNSGSTTLAVNGGSALTIYKDTATGPVVLTGSELTAGNLATVVYDAALGGFHLLVPVEATATGTPLTNVRVSKTANYTMASADCGATLALGGSAYFTLSLSDPTNYPATCQVTIANEDTVRAKKINLSGPGTTFLLWPGQTVTILRDNTTWLPNVQQHRWKVTSSITLYVDPVSGSDSNDCMTTGAAACRTINGAYGIIRDQFDMNGRQPTIQLADGTYSESVNIVSPLTGYNLLEIKGNITTPSNVLWTNSSGAALQTRDYGQVTVSGVKFQSSGGSYAMFAGQFGIIDFNNVNFGAYTGGYHIAADSQGGVNNQGAYTISGGANAHMLITSQSKVVMQGAMTVTLSGTPAFATAFMVMDSLAAISMGSSITFSGSATGSKYSVGNISIATCSLNTIPGSTAGTVDASSKVQNCL